MTKKTALVLVLVVLAAGWAFAQEDFSSMPKNTITVDIGPTIMGGAIAAIGDMMGEAGASSSGFGIGVQYERQLLQQLSVAARFAYLGGGVGMTMEDDNAKATVGVKLSSFSLESHVRYYPFGEIFFVDGMLGYANLSITFDAAATNKTTNVRDSDSITASRDYFKLGAKIGWRISFGERGGFTFEPSIGYYWGIAGGKTFDRQFLDGVDEDITNVVSEDEMDDFKESFRMLENYFFVGGPRITLAFGWRF
jgi:hypothetical protein